MSTGKWLTPVTDAETASKGRPQAMARSMQKLPTSWQRPTVLMEVSRHTARVRQVMGLVMLKSHASRAVLLHGLADPDQDRARCAAPG